MNVFVMGANCIQANETFNRLMEEDNETANKREQLKREKEKLELAMEKIANLELGDARAPGDVDTSLPGVELDDVMDEA